MSNDYTAQVVEATLFYPFLTYRNGNKYSVDLGNMSDADWDKVKAMGGEVGKVKNELIRTKAGHPAEKGQFLIVKSSFPLVWQDKEHVNTMWYWPDGRQLSEAEVGKLGNGTRVRIKVVPYTTESQAHGRNIGTNMLRAKVLEAVWYESGDSDDGLFDEGVVLQRNEAKVGEPVEEALEEVSAEVPLDKSDLDDEIPF